MSSYKVLAYLLQQGEKINIQLMTLLVCDTLN